MNYEESPPFSKSKTTLCFLVKEDKVLLALKKRGFGMGKWNGFGGKVETGETVEDAIKREGMEEVHVLPTSLKLAAKLTFHFEKEVEKLGKVEQTIVFLCDRWEGEPQESEEMRPQWYSKTQLPFTDMWEDDPFWLPLVLSGKKVEGKFWFDKQFTMINHSVTDIESFN